MRPAVRGHYLERTRLLDAMPRSRQSVVWLEAPYGFGKSILASQWVASLEMEGWRGAWISRPGAETRQALARLLGLPTSAPWPVVLEALWDEPTALVLDDLTGAEELTPLLEDVRGLLLLASRGSLPYAELPRALTAGRLTHIGPDDLALTIDEARRLPGFIDRADAAWEQTGGWPLPLHYAALTGGLPRLDGLADGLRASVDLECWREALLLACLTYLPSAHHVPATGHLAAIGFAQKFEGGARLHPLVARALKEAAPEELCEAVRELAVRLPPVLRAEAYEHAGLNRELGRLLEDPEAELDRDDPQGTIRWHALAPGPAGPVRRASVGSALCMTGDSEAGLRLLREAVAEASPDADARLAVLGSAVWFLAQSSSLAEARAVAEQAEPLLERAHHERVGRFLNNVSFIHFQAGDYDEAARVVERALRHYPPDSPLRFGPVTNLAVLTWNRTGDLERRLDLQREAVRLGRQHRRDALATACRDLARLHLLLGDEVVARRWLAEAVAVSELAPLVGIEARARLAELDGDLAACERLAAETARWSDAYTIDVVNAAWLTATRAHGTPAEVKRVAAAVEGAAGGFVKVALARTSAAFRETGRATNLLREAEGAYPNREFRLAWLAARYELTREQAVLDELLSQTTAGARVLPGLLALEHLPRDRPDLARHYPLKRVLASGWQEAVRLRVHEAPPLGVDLLGIYEVRVMGEAIDLSPRHREIVALYLLGSTREEIKAELWPEADHQKAKNNFGVQLNQLRKTLEPWRVATYVFEDGLRNVESDLILLKNALSQHDAARVNELYREPLAPGVALTAVLEAAAALRRAVVTTLIEGADEAEPRLALEWLERVLEIEPLEEAALRRSLALLVGQGRRREARGRLDEFAARLRAETGLEPLPETSSAV